MSYTHNRPRRRTPVRRDPYEDLYFSQLAREILQGAVFFSGFFAMMLFLVARA